MASHSHRINVENDHFGFVVELTLDSIFLRRRIYIYIFFLQFRPFREKERVVGRAIEDRLIIAWRDKSIPPGKVETLLSFVPGRKARKDQIEEKLETLEQRKKADLKESVNPGECWKMSWRRLSTPS